MKNTRRFQWEILLGAALLGLCTLLYVFHFLIFRDTHHIFIYLLGDLAFLPAEVLLVTLIIDRLLSRRERKSRLEKLNMVIGTFFSEVGTELLTYFSDCDPLIEKIRKDLVVKADWTDPEFARVKERLPLHDYSVDTHTIDLASLRSFLLRKREHLLRMLENPALLEHESFTDLLRAVFHLTEELENRKTVIDLPKQDLAHLGGDIRRAYSSLVVEWLAYMQHLKNNYPYLFSLSMRTNPFDETATAIIS